MVAKCSNAEIFVAQKWKSKIMDKISADVHNTLYLIVYTIKPHGGIFQKIQTVQNTATQQNVAYNLRQLVPITAILYNWTYKGLISQNQALCT